jgi:predicted thioesterase
VKNPFKPGDQKTFKVVVTEADTPNFTALRKQDGGGQVHPVYSTYAIARDAEWCGRLFVLDMKEADEEGIGTMASVEHVAPAHIGDEVLFTATVESVTGNEIVTTFEARSRDKLIARGRTAQKILKKEKVARLMGR